MSGGETVRVIVRCRPMNQREINLSCQTIVAMNTKLNQVILTNIDENTEPPKQFTFDAVYPEDSITENIYPESVFPLVESVLEGYNGTVFAYGQTGCGKSFTMQGLNIPGSPQRGIIPRSFEHVFEASGVASGTKFLIRASYLEIYNETIRDLLGKDIKAALDLKEYPDKGVQVSGLSWHECLNMLDCERLMERGNRNRATGATLMNKDSSRSHSIFTILVEMCSKNELTGKDHIRTGKLNLVDLAGSERQSKTQAEGERLREATRINLSLSALGNVISALVDGKSKHIPYRDSKLTRLLQDSLGGNTKTLMVAAVSPAHDNYDETLSTLRYANRAKNIKNKPKVNEDPRDAMMKQLQEEILRLKQELLGAGIGGTQGDQPTPGIDRINHDDEIEREKERLREEYEREVSEIRKQFENERLTKEEIQKKYEDLKLQYDCEVETLNSNKSDARQQQQSQESQQDRQQGQGLEQGQQQGTTTDGERSKNRRKSAKPKQDRTGQGQNENNENNGRTNDQLTIEEKLERLNQLEKKLVGGEQINNEETKKKRKKKLNEMKERQEKKRREFSELANDEDVLFKVFDHTQEQFHAATKRLEEEKQNIRRLESDNKDLQSEFERERQALFETIRGHERHILLLETMVQRMSELIPSSCNYRDARRVMKEAKYDEEKNIYILPAPMKQETNLPRFQSENGPTATRGRTEPDPVRLDPTGSPNAEYEADFDEPTDDQGNPTDFIQFDELERRHARNTDVESLLPERSRIRRQEQLLHESSALQRSKRPLQMNNSDSDYMNRRLNPFEPSTRLARRYGFSTDKP